MEDDRIDAEHRGALAVLGAPVPRNHPRWLFQAGKSAAACLLALLLDRGIGNPDSVTSTFVAVLCVSPVVLLGMRRARDQLAGSLVGGLWGTAMALTGWSLLAGVPIAVAGGILSSLALGFGRGTSLAAFTALFVQIVPWGGPFQTLGTRLLAVLIGVAAAFVVNVAISAFSYGSIFERRLRFAEATVSGLLVEAAIRGPATVRSGFAPLTELEAEIDLARGELAVRRAPRARARLNAAAQRVESLRRLLHLVLDLAHRLEEEDLPADAMTAWLEWLIHPAGTEPEVPKSLRATTLRIRHLGRTLRESPSSFSRRRLGDPNELDPKR